MPYNELLADRLREMLAEQPKKVEEKNMMGGLTFMVNGKMCVGIVNDDLMARIDPQMQQEALERRGCREMDFTGRPMKGFVFIDETGYKAKKDLDYWVNLALAYNDEAKASKKPASKKKK